jgi:hypothetical protein
MTHSQFLLLSKRFPYESVLTIQPGGTTVVAPFSSMIVAHSIFLCMEEGTLLGEGPNHLRSVL